ncbi:MAG: U32 family peptidase, partial [Bacilli bacterium]|nr:U32 family peptidase [Bacilli bacterium]
SLKDLALQEEILSFDSIVSSLKIEGRLKSLNYLYCVIKYYQSILAKKEDIIMFDNLKIAYNRHYTKGKILEQNSYKLSNNKRINNHGLIIGKVHDVNKNSITLNVNKPLYQKDYLRIFNDNTETGQQITKMIYNNKEVKMIEQGLVSINKNCHVHKNDVISIVKSERLINEINDNLKLYLNKHKYDLALIVELNKPLRALINNKEYVSDFIIENPHQIIMTKDDLKALFLKTNNTPIIFNVTCLSNEQFFISKGLVNQFKRDIINDLIKQLQAKPNFFKK